MESNPLLNAAKVDEERRALLLRSAALLGGASSLVGPGMANAAELEGVELADKMVVSGQTLLLNGYAVRKRGYFKGDVTALYLPERRRTAEGVLKLDGVRRIQRNILRTFTSSTLSRIFIADFKQVATDEEFRLLIPEISKIGAAYSQVRQVRSGDVINLDWVPGTGWMADFNGKQLQTSSGDKELLAINNPLAYQVYLRMFIGPTAPDTLRKGLLGLT